MSGEARGIRRWIAMVMLVAIAGCQSTPEASSSKPADTGPKAPADATDANLDLTAVRLHDLTGVLLRYYAINGEFPAQLNALRDAGLLEHKEDVIDPVSGRTFLYFAVPPAVRGFKGRLVLCQPMQTAAAGRWALLVESPQDGDNIIAQVKCVPEPVIRAVLNQR